MFRWKRGLVHALIPFALVIAAGVVLLLAVHPVDEHLFGEGVGRFAGFAAVAGLGVSYLVQTGRRRAGLALGIGLVAAITALTVALVVGVEPAPKLSAADRAQLVEITRGTEHRLKHPTLGFSIQRPPASYAYSVELTAQMATSLGDSDGVSYAYAETPPAAVLVIGVLNDTGGSRDSLRHEIDGMRRGIDHSAEKAGGKVEYVHDEITGDDAHLESNLHAVYSGVHMQIHSYPIHPPGRAPAIISVMVISPDPSALADVLTSFRPD